MSEIMSHHEMVAAEEFNLQKGMNFRPRSKQYSILLMSVRTNAPYEDDFNEHGFLIYEGHDVTRVESKQPKTIDQPMQLRSGKLTENGKFYQAAMDYNSGKRSQPERVKVYEKIINGVWADKGFFDLVGVQYSFHEKQRRKVFKFTLKPVGSMLMEVEELEEFEFSRRIPTPVKQIVWERDKGKCITCGATQGLHFDHIIPFSKGGSSTDPANVQILCGKHNIFKSDNIE